MVDTGKRIYWIDIAKGLAIILVVLGHVLKGYIDAGMYKDNINSMKMLYDAIYTFHMPLFILISGFVFAKAYLRDGLLRKDSWKKQLLNIILLYFVHSIALGGLKLIFSGFVNNKISFETILLIPFKPIQLYWYIYILAFFYLIFSSKILNNTNYHICLAVLFIISLCSNYLDANIFNGFFQIKRILYYAFFFYFGLLSANGKITETARRRLALAIGLPSVIISIILIPLRGDIRKIPIISVIIGIGISLLVIEAIIFISKKSELKWLQLCGKRSLEIYLIHTYICTIIRAIFKKIHLDNAFFGILLNAVTAIILPICISFVLQKIRLWEIVFKPYSFILSKRTSK